jgi:hypothetical protein
MCQCRLSTVIKSHTKLQKDNSYKTQTEQMTRSPVMAVRS